MMTGPQATENQATVLLGLIVWATVGAIIVLERDPDGKHLNRHTKALVWLAILGPLGFVTLKMYLAASDKPPV